MRRWACCPLKPGTPFIAIDIQPLPSFFASICTLVVAHFRVEMVRDQAWIVSQRRMDKKIDVKLAITRNNNPGRRIKDR
jgi:hypothetical protein